MNILGPVKQNMYAVRKLIVRESSLKIMVEIFVILNAKEVGAVIVREMMNRDGSAPQASVLSLKGWKEQKHHLRIP